MKHLALEWWILLVLLLGITLIGLGSVLFEFRVFRLGQTLCFSIGFILLVIGMMAPFVYLMLR